MLRTTAWGVHELTPPKTDWVTALLEPLFPWNEPSSLLFWGQICTEIVFLYPVFNIRPRTAVPNLWDLMPDDLSWSWCNNNRNKMHNTCNALEPSRSHPYQPSSLENCLPQNQFLVPKMLGSTDVEHSRYLQLKKIIMKITNISNV